MSRTEQQKARCGLISCDIFTLRMVPVLTDVSGTFSEQHVREAVNSTLQLKYLTGIKGI